MTQKPAGFFTHKSAACTGMTQRLGSARTVKQRTCMWPLRASWASPSLRLGSAGKHLESEHYPGPRQNHKSCAVTSAMLLWLQASQYDQPRLKGRGIRLPLQEGDVKVPLQKSMWHKRFYSYLWLASSQKRK